MKRISKYIILGGLILAISSLYVSRMFPRPKANPDYQYVVSKGLEKKIAQPLIKKLSPLDINDKKFIDIISDYPVELQEVCINSDILDDAHISKKELENTKKATLEGIVNPKEIYAVLANGSGPDNPDFYSRIKTEHSLTNVLSFYKLLKNNNVPDDNISLLIYNPSKINIFETATHDFFFKENRKLLTIKNGKQIKSTVPPSKLLPMPEDEIKIDDNSTKDNFLESIKNIKSDYNDTVYIVYSNPGGQIPESLKRLIIRESSYIQFSGELVGDFHLNSAIKNLEYNQMTILQNSGYSSSLLKNLNSLRKIRNILAISSPTNDEIKDAMFSLGVVDKHLDNPKQSIKDIMEIEREIYKKEQYGPEVFYFNEQGIRRSPKECSWFYEPLIKPQE